MGWLNMQIVFYFKRNWELIDNIYPKSGNELLQKLVAFQINSFCYYLFQGIYEPIPSECS